jgi:hypothetical protein
MPAAFIYQLINDFVVGMMKAIIFGDGEAPIN